jgi:hypothetical protein
MSGLPFAEGRFSKSAEISCRLCQLEITAAYEHFLETLDFRTSGSCSKTIQDYACLLLNLHAFNSRGQLSTMVGERYPTGCNQQDGRKRACAVEILLHGYFF